jgi:hypothetical protein
VSPLELLPLVAAEDLWSGPSLVSEEIGDLDPDGGCEPLQGGDARARAAALELADKTLADSRGVGDFAQRESS